MSKFDQNRINDGWEKLCTNKQTNRHYENNGHLAVNHSNETNTVVYCINPRICIALLFLRRCCAWESKIHHMLKLEITTLVVYNSNRNILDYEFKETGHEWLRQRPTTGRVNPLYSMGTVCRELCRRELPHDAGHSYRKLAPNHCATQLTETTLKLSGNGEIMKNDFTCAYFYFRCSSPTELERIDWKYARHETTAQSKMQGWKLWERKQRRQNAGVETVRNRNCCTILHEVENVAQASALWTGKITLSTTSVNFSVVVGSLRINGLHIIKTNNKSSAVTDRDRRPFGHNRQLVSWSLTSLFSTNMAISETNRGAGSNLKVGGHGHYFVSPARSAGKFF